MPRGAQEGSLRLQANLLRRVCYRGFTLLALFTFGAFCVRSQSVSWPGPHGIPMGWLLAYGWVLAACVIGSLVGLLVGVCVGAVEFMGSRKTFTLLNWGFWFGFWLSCFVFFFIVPAMI